MGIGTIPMPGRIPALPASAAMPPPDLTPDTTSANTQNRTDAAYDPVAWGLFDAYPKTASEHAALLNWLMAAYQAADRWRQPQEEKWSRWYKLYRSYVKRRKGSWRSANFWSVVFYTVEAITPRLVAQVPEPVVLPIEPGDQDGAAKLEQALKWAATQSNLYVELVKAVKSSLKYGTGILKTYEWQDVRRKTVVTQVPVPITETQQIPQFDPANMQPLVDLNGQPLVGSREVITGYQPGQPVRQRTTYLAYDGPRAEFQPLTSFWVAPEADDIQSARYVIHQSFRDWRFVQRRIAEGTFRLPLDVNLGPNDITQTDDEYLKRRLSVIERGGDPSDVTRRPVEILEFWSDEGLVYTVINRKAIVRAHENPFDHGMKPFVRIVDHLVEGEFYGIGEIEPIEGLQDVLNALVNQRIDAVRMALNMMLAVNTREIVDLRELHNLRPGAIIRTKGDLPPREVIQPIDLGPGATATAFAEANAIQQVIEKITGVSAYQLGTDPAGLNQTATGASILSEAGSSRYTVKIRLMELMGLKDLYRQYGGLLLQFMPEEKWIRLFGPDGGFVFEQLTPEVLQGNYDYDIESQSTSLTESQRRSDAISLFQALVQAWPPALPQLVRDLLDVFGRKNPQKYGLPPEGMGMMGMLGTPGAPPMMPPGMGPPGMGPEQPPAGPPGSGGAGGGPAGPSGPQGASGFNPYGPGTPYDPMMNQIVQQLMSGGGSPRSQR